MQFATGVYAASLLNRIDPPAGWTLNAWQPDTSSGFSAGYYLWRKWIAKLGLILMIGASMNAEAGLFGLFGGGEKWKEEVQLSDGKVIVIEREQLNESGGDEWALNRGGGKPKEYRIRFASQNETGKMIEWRSVKKSPRTWPEVPLVLDFSGQPTIFTLVAISAGCEVYSKYVYRHGTWQEEQLSDQFESHATNLFYGNRKNMPSFLDLTEKAKRQSDSGYRRALKTVGPNLKVCG
jgi:hypothetical protein